MATLEPVVDSEKRVDEEKAVAAQLESSQAATSNTSASQENADDLLFDHGVIAWLQCLGTFCMFFGTWGIVNSFGVFQAYYAHNILSHKSPSSISWIGSIQGFLVVFSGIVAGPVFDRGYLRSLITFGSFMVVFGVMMTSISTQYWHVFLAQGICVGLGGGCLFTPGLAVLPSYFTKRRSLAMGIATTGTSLGGIIYPIMFRQLQPNIGFGWTVRAMGLLAGVTLITPIFVMRMRATATSRRKLDLSLWKEAPFVLYTIGVFFAFVGYFIPLFYVQLYAIEEIGIGRNLGFYMVSIANSGALVGRVVPNYFADKWGHLNTLILLSTGIMILGFCWIPISSYASLIVFAILYGFFSGGFFALGATCVVTLSPSLDVVGDRMGWIFGVCGIGLLIGSPIAGALLKITWVALQSFCGVCMAVALMFLIATRIVKVGMNLGAKI